MIHPLVHDPIYQALHHSTGSFIFAPADVDGLLTDLGLDFALLPTATQLVDAGTSEHAPADDRLGVLRPQGAAVDVGPHELVPTD